MSSAAHPPRKTRTDIQALRGFAVLIVVGYHATLRGFEGGYLGVDVFFVISGFLITRLVKQGIENGTFRFRDFYFRRAKRLLPAAYVTFLVTALAAPYLLTSPELADFRAQLLGAISFTANLVLWQQTGYFENASELKPLLHVWSLSLEEQYYFILPATLMLVPRRFWLRGALGILIGGFTLCAVYSGYVNVCFYLLPTRSWELAVGSVGALAPASAIPVRLVKAAFWPALAALLLLPLKTFGPFHPGPQELLACLATLVVILREHPALSAGLPMLALSKVGDLSYSLYLVHWPLLAFFNNAWVGELLTWQTIPLRAGLVGLSLVLAYLLYRYVEEPIRRAEIRRKRVAVVVAGLASAALALLAVGTLRPSGTTKDYAYLRRTNFGFDEACEFHGNFEPKPECRNSDQPEILVWGDSYAMHLIPGLLGSDPATAPPIAQATESVCGPFLGAAPVVAGTVYDRRWAEGCLRFNDAVLSYLERTPSLTTVVLSSPFTNYTRGGPLLRRDRDDAGYRMASATLTESFAGMRRTVEAVRALRRRVVVVAPPPSENTDMSRCVERRERHLLLLGADAGCRIRVSRYHLLRSGVVKFLEGLPQQAGVPVIWFNPYLCDSQFCRTSIDGIMIYRDLGHLSVEGSRFLAKQVSLVDQVRQKAR